MQSTTPRALPRRKAIPLELDLECSFVDPHLGKATRKPCGVVSRGAGGYCQQGQEHEHRETPHRYSAPPSPATVKAAGPPPASPRCGWMLRASGREHAPDAKPRGHAPGLGGAHPQPPGRLPGSHPLGLIRASTACRCVCSVRLGDGDGRGVRAVRAVVSHYGHLKSAIAKATYGFESHPRHGNHSRISNPARMLATRRSGPFSRGTWSAASALSRVCYRSLSIWPFAHSSMPKCLTMFFT